MFIKQISIFLENIPGSLRELTHLLGEAGIDLMALSIADTQSFGIVRTIVKEDQIDKAVEILRASGYTARVNHVICAIVEDRPLGLCELLEMIESAGLSIEYLYSFLRGTGKDAPIVLRLSDQEKGVALLQARNVRVFSQEEIDAL